VEIINCKLQIDKCIKENLCFPEISNIQQRGIADKIEKHCNEIIMSNFRDVSMASTRISIEDVSVGRILVDHKTSDRSLKFNMPNLISVNRLIKLIQKDISFIINFVLYDSSEELIINNFSLSIYELNWDHLAIQNLGTGQLQIKKVIKFLGSPVGNLSQQAWQEKFMIECVRFYDRLVGKTNKRKKNMESLLKRPQSVI